MSTRKLPNILITGTPGTGKTTTAEQVATITGFQHLQVGNLVKERGLHDGWDQEFDCYTLNEDKVKQRATTIFNRPNSRNSGL